MALIQKTNPVGVDVQIDEFQVYLYDALGISDWEMYPRAYFNTKGNSLTPEHYEGSEEYDNVMYDDTHDMSSFFITDTTRDIAFDGLATTQVSLIVQADLPALYPLITHRADEELTNAIHQSSNRYIPKAWFKLERVLYTIDEVYREFDKSQIRLTDISNRYVARFEYNVRYAANCIS